MKSEYIPNIITIFRLILIPPIVVSLLVGYYHLAFVLFTTAGITDAVDGYLARRFHWISRWGAMVDPVADKLLMVMTFLTLGYIKIVPLWLLLTVVLRDIIIVLGGMAYHFLIGAYEFKPTLISKCNTFLQIILIIALVFQVAFTVIPDFIINLMMILVFATSVISLIDYVIVWGMKAWRTQQIK